MNPVARVFATLLAALAFAGAFFFGLAVLAVLAVFVVLFGLIFWFRSWRAKNQGGEWPGPGKTAERQGSVIDAEYTVVSRRRN